MRMSNWNLDRSKCAQSTRIGLINAANRMIVSNAIVCSVCVISMKKHSSVSILLISNQFHIACMPNGISKYILYTYVNKSTYVGGNRFGRCTHGQSEISWMINEAHVPLATQFLDFTLHTEANVLMSSVQQQPLWRPFWGHTHTHNNLTHSLTHSDVHFNSQT